MKFKLLILLITISILKPEDKQQSKSTKTEQVGSKKLILIDRIEAVVAEGDQVKVVTSLDVARRGYDGTTYLVQDLVNEDLLEILGDKFKINVDDKDVTRYLQKMNASETQMKAIAQANGYATLSELYEQFKKTFKAQSALSFKTQSELVFSEDVILQYCKNNPQIREANYILQMSFVPFVDSSKQDELKNEIQKYIKHEPNKISVDWDAPITILKNQVSKENSFIFDMKDGQIYIKDMPQGFSLFKMIKSSPEYEVTLEERRLEIVNILRNEKYEEVVKKVVQELRNNALILTPSFDIYPIPELN
ncbi:hypothetical protein A3F66_05950 [candidate division TM6 bacterium RIFCSPHIGHO2_12_FULL_32_22]|nr:MAG: hypothetical protein A3F66_05950 [candidate division TM6 bacterium RIFCSPHIGHO2_12_FULL_32_22]